MSGQPHEGTASAGSGNDSFHGRMALVTGADGTVPGDGHRAGSAQRIDVAVRHNRSDGEPDELGDLVAYPAGEGSRFVVGETIVIDGGYTLL